MKSIIYLLLCMLITFSACTQKNKKINVKTPVTDSVTQDTTNVSGLFYKRLQGTIGDKSVVVQLHKNGNDYNGSYYADGSSYELLTDTILNENEFILFINNSPDYYFDKDLQQPRLHLKRFGSGFTGEWISGKKDKTLTVKLENKYPEGSYPFTFNNYKDSIKAYPAKAKSPTAEISFYYLLANQTNESAKWLNNQLRKINEIKPDEDVLKALQKQAKTYLNGYREEIKDANATADNEMNWMNYTDYNNQNIQFNDKGFVIISNFNDNYSGGAHGNYNSSFYRFDVKNQKKLELNDLLKIDSNLLQKILEKNLRKSYNIKPTEKLTTVLFENYLKANKNFYFNENGITFLYNPYEVASYAQGQIVVFIPYSDLKDHLNIDFMKRIAN
ncbi:DUF3298 and DUF4163 domain-containing protein [Pedobacter changchengzhani]|nr:DUF3298 and DUF4163 domain-containing protein [Pedobacter changchengzhani]